MSLDTEVLAKLQMAVIQGRSLESLGIELTDEVMEAYETLQSEYQNVPTGVMAAIVDDFEWGSFDKLIEATEKAVGPIIGDKPIKEMMAERLAEVEKAKRNNPPSSD